jgi:predicted RNA-binding protein with PUA-like domain
MISDKSHLAMHYFLAKTDPESYALDDLRRERRTTWDGVANPQALRAIAAMKPGDLVLIYHSGGESAIRGLARVASEPRPDPANAKLTVIDLEFAGAWEPAVTLQEVKQSGRFPDLPLVRQPRLSTMPVPPEFVQWIEERSRLRKPA